VKRIAAYLLGMVALSFLGSVIVLALATQARAQLTDRPILHAYFDWKGSVLNISLRDKRGCAGGWVLPADPFLDYEMVIADVDGGELSGAMQALVAEAINGRNHIELTKLRTRNVNRDAVHVRPCVEALAGTMPPPRWIIAPSASGLRAAYALKEDGTRGAKVLDVPTTMVGLDGKVWPVPCAPRIRSKETTASVYGLAPHPTGLVVVALCKPNKI
jgi:hypothetical protein